MLLSVLLFLFTVEISSSHAFVHHFGIDAFDVSVHVEYDSACSTKSNFSQIVTVPRESSLLNVLEHSNQLYPVFNGFKVLYIANSSYFLTSLNNDSVTPSCHWTVKTDPPTINPPTTDKGVYIETIDGITNVSPVGLNNAYVTNIGMTVIFVCERVPDGSEKKTRKEEWLSKFKGINMTDLQQSAQNISVQYEVTGTTTSCPLSFSTGRREIPSTPLTLSIPAGASALNVMEAAVNLEPAHNFILKNIFGKYYIVDSIGGSSTAGCVWCAYFSPFAGPPAAPSYLLTADINNFIIPLSGGTLTMHYDTSCSAALDHFKRGILDFKIPLPPHYNPFMVFKHGEWAKEEMIAEGKASAHFTDEL